MGERYPKMAKSTNPREKGWSTPCRSCGGHTHQRKVNTPDGAYLVDRCSWCGAWSCGFSKPIKEEPRWGRGWRHS